MNVDEQIALLESQIAETAAAFAAAAGDPAERKSIADELTAQQDLLRCLKAERATRTRNPLDIV
ncbi:hypothetical protein AB0D10_05275 [Kitasatospora sp. NPDC048545]|uniref:hypothetical protein n=1 Tax=Kitasatospora sp. NPDC048545 TaxID=3157208 RepID=UPI0033F43D2D